MAIFTAIATAIATGLGMTLASVATATFITVTAGVLQALTILAAWLCPWHLLKRV